MKFNKMTIFSIITLMLMITSPFSSIATIPNEVNVGDTFSIKILKAANSNKVNGTEYGDAPEANVGDIVDIEVTNLGNSDYGGTYVNVSESVNGESSVSTSTYIDEWLLAPFLSILVGAFSLAFFPTYTSFDAPEPEPSTDRTAALFPYFATSNVTAYTEMENDIIDLDDDLNTIENMDSNTAKAVADYDQDASIFTFEFSWSFVNSTTYMGQDAKISFDSSVMITIDVARSFVTDFLFILSLEMSIGQGSLVSHLEAAYEEYTGEDTATDALAGLSGLPAPGFVVLLLSMFAVLLPIRRKIIK